MKKLVILLFLLLILTGCGGKKPESAAPPLQDVDFSYIKRIAVLPFNNKSNSQVQKQVRDITIAALLESGRYEMVDRESVDAVLGELTTENNTVLAAPVLKDLGERLETDAFISGTVNTIKGGAFPEVDLTLDLIDARTAHVKWRSTAFRSSYTVWNRMLSMAPKDEFEVIRTLVRDMIASIPK